MRVHPIIAELRWPKVVREFLLRHQPDGRAGSFLRIDGKAGEVGRLVTGKVTREVAAKQWIGG